MVCMTKLVVLFLAGLKVTWCTLRGSKAEWGEYIIVPTRQPKGYRIPVPDFSLAQVSFVDRGVTLWRHGCNAETYLSGDARIISSTSMQEIPALETNKRE